MSVYFKASWKKSMVARSFALLHARDRKKVVLITFIQVVLGFLDLLGIAIVGVLGALTISGVSSRQPGNRVSRVLETLGISEFSLQNQALILGVLATLILVAKTLFSVVAVRRTTYFLSRSGAKISSTLISKLLTLPLTQIREKSMQQTLYSLTSGVDAITLGVLNSSAQMLADSALLIIMLTGLFVVDPSIALPAFLIFSVVIIVLYRLLSEKTRTLGRLQAEFTVTNSERILEVIGSYREIIVRNRRGFYAEEIGKIRMQLANTQAERTFLPNVSKFVIEVTVVVGSLLISAIQFTLYDAAHAVAVLSVFLAASTRIAPALLRLQQGGLSIRGALGTAGPTLDLAERLKDIDVTPAKIRAIQLDHKGFNSRIHIKNLQFCYPEQEERTIKNLNLELNEGEVVALVGPSGAGKSTLVDLILGVLVPESGEILVSGLPPLEAVDRWPGAIGYVPQDVVISNASIKQNICMGFQINDIPDELVFEAAEIAKLRDFISELPNGMATEVGDRGGNLSGGQRQRLGIARSMVTKPNLLILDEATSSLDGKTEADITDAIHNMKGNVTVIMIAHRLSTVREATRVIYLDEGTIIADGTFEEVRRSVPDFDEQARLMGL